MSKPVRTFLFAATLLMSAFGSAPRAHALSISLGNTAVWAYVGQTSGTTWVIAWTGSACAFYKVGFHANGGLAENVYISGGSGGDGIGVVINPLTWCARAMSAPIQNGFGITLSGEGGTNALDAGSDMLNVLYTSNAGNTETLVGNRTRAYVWGTNNGGGSKTIYGSDHTTDILFGSYGTNQFCEHSNITAAYMVGSPVQKDYYCGWGTYFPNYLDEARCSTCGAGY